MEWYFAELGSPVGPLSDAQLEEFVAAGRITDATLVWRTGWPDWLRRGDLGTVVEDGAPGAAPAPPTALCGECGGRVPLDESFAFAQSHVCAACKPVFLQRVREGARIPFVIEYGGFWIRYAAKLIDWLLLTVVMVALMAAVLVPVIWGLAKGNTDEPPILGLLAFELVLITVQIFLPGAYFTYMTGRYGATLGKMVFDLKVVKPKGEEIGYTLALVRFFAEYLCQMTFYIGYLMAAFDDERRGLHDRLCNTRVVKA